MSMFEKIREISHSDNYIIKHILRPIWIEISRSKFIYNLRYKPYMDDKTYIKKLYKKRFNNEINLSNPKNFNEKNNWRKLYDRKDIYTFMVDKYKIKGIIKEKCGENYSFKLLGVWDDPSLIDFEKLPEKFVLKVNHAGGVIVCRNKNIFNKEKAIKELKHDLKFNYFYRSREWPYKNVERKVIAEEYMGENLIDYKNYCFNGKLLYTFVWKNKSRVDGRKPEAFITGCYDRNWEKIDIKIGYPSIDNDYTEKPKCYDEMINIAEKMSKDIPFVRVDIYIINNHPYIGEMTFFPWGGFMKFIDEEWNNKFGEMEKLPYEK